MSSSLDRLKAAANKGAAASTTPAPETVAAAPAAAAPAPTPPPAVASAPAAPVAAAPVTQAAAPAAAAPAASTAVSVPSTIETDAEAENALALLYGPLTTGEADAPTPAEMFEEIDSGGGLAFKHPFAQVRKGNWDVHKSCPQTIYDFMPAGKRPFWMIYLGYRIGAIGWPVTSGATGGAPPLFRYAIPHRRMFAASTEVTRQTLGFGSKIQYKKVHEDKYKHIGKLTPETHIFGWTPNTGYVILTVQGFSPSELTAEGLGAKTIRDIEGLGPLCFTIEEHVTVNKKVTDPNAKNARWSDYWIKADFQPTETKSTALFSAWEEHKKTGIKEFANQSVAFHKALDYQGLSQEEISRTLAQYAAACG